MSAIRLAGVAIIVLLLCGLAVFVYTGPLAKYTEARTIGRNVANFNELSERFEALAEKKGAEYAFDVLGIADLPPNTDLHLLGHTIGEALYREKGVSGIALCTQDFRNACSHSLVIGALNEYGGEQALDLIRDACKKAPGGSGAYTMCYHGLGHGVFAYFGYDLEPTIDFCKKTATAEYREREYKECVGGTIMELMGGGGHDRDAWLIARQRYLIPSDPLAPCMSALMPEDLKQICLTYLTPRFFDLAGADIGIPDPRTFPKAFSYCEAIPISRADLRASCFGGFGKEFVPLAGGRDIRAVDEYPDAVYAKAASWCDLAESDEGKAACIQQALASVYWGGESDPAASFRFCTVAPMHLRDACYEELASNIAMYARETKSAECALLPEQYRAACLTPV